MKANRSLEPRSQSETERPRTHRPDRSCEQSPRLWEATRLRVAITGGACSGKSTVMGFFKDLGVPGFSADEVARELTAKGTLLARRLAEIAGPGTIGADGELDRKEVARRMFADPAMRRQIEHLLHEPILEAMEEAASKEKTAILCFEIPLLVEAGLQERFDRVVLCTCGKKEQTRRLMERWEGDSEMVRRILASQVSDSERRAYADFVVRTNRPLDSVKRRVEQIFAYLRRTLHVQAKGAALSPSGT